MKTIIVPTNYSSNALNATEYAASLAKVAKAKLSLLHVYHLPAEIEGTSVKLISLKDLNRRHKTQLSKLANKISFEYDIQVESHVYPGYISEILPDFVQKQSGDLVVMGMRGMSNDQIFFGSVTTNILKKVNFPLLIIRLLSNSIRLSIYYWLATTMPTQLTKGCH